MELAVISYINKYIKQKEIKKKKTKKMKPNLYIQKNDVYQHSRLNNV